MRKSSQEIEIDHLLAEEFSCDPSFAERFASACGLSCSGFQVSAAIAEPSLGGEGFGDLLVDGTARGLKVAFLVEDKITAAPAVRQAERYAAHANWLRGRGWDRVWTILVAPASYRGERAGYDANVDLETIASIMSSPDPVRLAYRRAIIERALAKKITAGVRVPDVALYELKAAYFRYASGWLARENLDLQFPTLRESYYEGDSWIVPIRSTKLPDRVMLRHRLWTSTKAECGLVDLIVSPATMVEGNRLRQCHPAGSYLELYSNGKGVQVSFPVPELRQKTGFDPSIATKAFQSMRTLMEWYSKVDF